MGWLLSSQVVTVVYGLVLCVGALSVFDSSDSSESCESCDSSDGTLMMT